MAACGGPPNHCCGRLLCWLSLPLTVLWLGLGTYLHHMQDVMSPPKSPPMEDYPATFDVSIHFFGLGNVRQVHRPGQPSPFYDPTKPTVLYLHGWQPGTSVRRFRESFDTRFNVKLTKPSITSDTWVWDGWNVAAFYWNQLADEDLLEAAEAKLYTAHGPSGMRWRQCDGAYQPPATNLTVAELLVERYVEAFRQYHGPGIRLVGHSMGAQLALEFHRHLVRRRALRPALRPRRIELLDPFCSAQARPYLALVRSPCDLMASNARTAASQGVALQVIQTSVVADSAATLKPVVAWVYWRPRWLPAWDFRDQHLAAVNLYFASFTPLTQRTFEQADVARRGDLGVGASAAEVNIHAAMAWADHGLYLETVEDGVLPSEVQKVQFGEVSMGISIEHFMVLFKIASAVAFVSAVAHLLLIAGSVFQRRTLRSRGLQLLPSPESGVADVCNN